MNDLIELDCPNCVQKLRVPANLAGKQVKCPACAAVIPVPGESGITSGLPARAAQPLADDDIRPRRRRDGDDDDIDDFVRQGGGYQGSGLTVMAICLLVVAVIGLILDILNAVWAVVGTPPPVNPNDPPFMQEMARAAFGPFAVIVQSSMAVVAAIIIVGAIQILRRKTWGLGLAACILSMLHIGSLCCVVGLPLGIWGIVLMVDKDVKSSFS